MSKKEELLKHYTDYRYRYLRYYFPMVIDEVPIKEIKEEINNEEKIFYQKEKIDNIFKDKICEYLNAKFDIVKLNLNFLNNEYEKFEYDYELCDKMLWFINYRYLKQEIEFPELVDDFSIKDSINLVKEFYTDLLKDNPNDVNVINYIADNKVDVLFEPNRSVTEVSTSDISAAYTPDLLFLIVLVHEIAHSYAYYKTDNLMGSFDTRTIEIESSFVEKLFLKYLKEKGYSIIREENKIRAVNDKDLETYFLYSFYGTMAHAYKIIDEKDFIDNLGEDFEINRESFNNYLNYSPYYLDYVSQAAIINDLLDDYLPDEYKKVSKDILKNSLDDLFIYNYNEFGSFTFSTRYIGCYLLSSYFEDIMDDEKSIKYFKEFLNSKNDYSFSDTCDLFGIDINDTIMLPTTYMQKYLDIVNKKELKVRRYPYVTDEYVKTELDDYNELIKKTKESDGLKQEEMILIRKLLHLYNKTKITNDTYPFDINSQLDDNDVEEIDKIQKRLIKYYNNETT